MASPYCEHPDEEVTITPTNSMWGGAECYCACCGHHWHVPKNELDAIEARLLNPPLRTLEDLEDQDASV